MNRRAAILRAADRIELHPHAYTFMKAFDDGGPACALVWIGRCAGLANRSAWCVAKEFLELELSGSSSGFVGTPEEIEFFKRMDGLTDDTQSWMLKPDHCARALRAYADKYHPVVLGMSNNVRELFRPEEIAA